MRINQLGNVYDMGRPYPQAIRENILDLHNDSLSVRQISANARVSAGFVQKVLKEYNVNNYSVSRKFLSGRNAVLMNDQIRSYLETEKLIQPSMRAFELQQRLLLDGVCFLGEIPAKTTVNDFLHKYLKMMKKKIKQIPLETITGPNVDKLNQHLEEISRIDPVTLHFFDETSVIRTEGNRRQGNSYIGTPALEYQRYASNANYTVNLLQSALGVDHYNILQGPSNGNELLLFFDDVLTMQKPDGSVVLERGDTVVMDNCGFHHGHFTEGLLTACLTNLGCVYFSNPLTVLI